MVVGTGKSELHIQHQKSLFVNPDMQKTAEEAVLRGEIFRLWMPDEVVCSHDGIAFEASTFRLFPHSIGLIETGVMRHPECLGSSLSCERAALLWSHVAIASDILLPDTGRAIGNQEVTTLEEGGEVFRETAIPGVSDFAVGCRHDNPKRGMLAKTVVHLVGMEMDCLSHAPSIVIAQALDIGTKVVPEVRVFRHMPFPHFPETRDGSGYAVRQSPWKIDVEDIERVFFVESRTVGKEFSTVLRLDEGWETGMVWMAMAHEDIGYQVMSDTECLQGEPCPFTAIKQERAISVLDEKGGRTTVSGSLMDTATSAGADRGDREIALERGLQRAFPCEGCDVQPLIYMDFCRFCQWMKRKGRDIRG